jgi:hypothetical protein
MLIPETPTELNSLIPNPIEQNFPIPHHTIIMQFLNPTELKRAFPDPVE